MFYIMPAARGRAWRAASIHASLYHNSDTPVAAIFPAIKKNANGAGTLRPGAAGFVD